MALVHWADSRLNEQRIAALELRYRHTHSACLAAQASYSSVCAAAQIDELEMRRALARVQHLMGQLADLQVAMEVLEEDVTADYCLAGRARSQNSALKPILMPGSVCQLYLRSHLNSGSTDQNSQRFFMGLV